MKDKIEVVAFDADDTLWENEVYFQEFEHQFCDLLKAYQLQSAVSQDIWVWACCLHCWKLPDWWNMAKLRAFQG